jgi:phosphonate transport system substrate-binding protein
MSSPAPRLTNQWIPLSFAFFVLLIFFLGCSGGGDTKEVDFSDTVQVARPGERPSADLYLRVAVGAMISPKETTVYYRQWGR